MNVEPAARSEGAPQQAGDEVPAGTRARVFALTWLSYASYYVTRKNLSVAKKTIEREEGVTRTQFADIETGYLAAYAAGQFFWGLAGDRLGARRVLVIGMLATAACSLAFGLSSAFLAFAVIFALNGLAQSSGWPGNVKVMSAWFPRVGRGTVMGAWATNYQIGPLLATPIAAFFLAQHGWRAAFFGPAVWVAIVALSLLFFLPVRRARSELPAGGSIGPAELADARRRVLRTPLVWGIGAAYFFMKLTRYVLLFWLPYFMEDRLGYSTAMAALVALAFEAGGTAGAVTIGLISDRLLGGRRLGIGIFFLVGLAAALPLYAWAAPLGTAANLASLALVGFFLYGPDTLLTGAAAQDLGGPAAATAAGVINGMGSIGPIFQGRLTSIVSRDYGWATLFSVLGVGAIGSALILLPFWLRRRRRSEE